MKKAKIALIGVGRQGKNYIKLFLDGEIENAMLISVCDIDPEKLRLFKLKYPNISTYESYEDMMNKEDLDGVIVVTPHYSHPKICAVALKHNLYVLSDKPIGVRMSDVEKELFPLNKDKFQMMFNQRMIPEYNFIKEVLNTEKIGKLKNYIWEITDWYRPQAYYELEGWHSTWYGEGGGLIINQCVHNIDMINWLFGKPEKVDSKLYCGKYHKTQVDDSAIVFFEHINGVNGILISSTGELPGTNRLELSFDGGKLVRESNGKITIYQNDMLETEHSKICKMNPNNGKFFRPKFKKKTYNFEIIGHGHKQLLQNFVNFTNNIQLPVTNFEDGKNCLEVINAIYLSTWLHDEVIVPTNYTQYDKMLNKQIKNESEYVSR